MSASEFFYYILLAIFLLIYFIIGVSFMGYLNTRVSNGSSAVFIFWPIWPIILIIFLSANWRSVWKKNKK